MNYYYANSRNEKRGLTQVPFESGGGCLTWSTYWNETAPVPLQACVHPQSVAALLTHSMGEKMNKYLSACMCVNARVKDWWKQWDRIKIKRENNCERLLKLFFVPNEKLSFSAQGPGLIKINYCSCQSCNPFSVPTLKKATLSFWMMVYFTVCHRKSNHLCSDTPWLY